MGAVIVTKIEDALQNVAKLGFDTAPVIYFVEINPRYDALVTRIFERVDLGFVQGFTSVVTLSEVLVQPILNANKLLQEQYRDRLLDSLNFHTLSITAEIAERAAELRARYRLRTPDALQLAAVIVAGCEAFLCNDKDLRRVAEIKILVLDELEI